MCTLQVSTKRLCRVIAIDPYKNFVWFGQTECSQIITMPSAYCSVSYLFRAPCPHSNSCITLAKLTRGRIPPSKLTLTPSLYRILYVCPMFCLLHFTDFKFLNQLLSRTFSLLHNVHLNFPCHLCIHGIPLATVSSFIPQTEFCTQFININQYVLLTMNTFMTIIKNC